jgi:anti-sigma B factor antagonist
VTPSQSPPAETTVPGGLEVGERDVEGVRILTVEGDLDLAGAVPLCERVDAAQRNGRSRIVVDLERLGFCDSRGLRALMGAAREVGFSAGRLIVVPPARPEAARVFTVGGATEFLPLCESVSAALAKLGRRVVPTPARPGAATV